MAQLSRIDKSRVRIIFLIGNQCFFNLHKNALTAENIFQVLFNILIIKYSI